MNNAVSQYFISCVSKELGSYRRMLKHHLSALRGGVEVKIQEDFIQGNDTLLEELNAFVRDCEGVIHLVGERCGELPTDQHVQVLEQLLQRAVENRYSMTQWEYHLARHHDKRTLVYLTTPNARIDEAVKQSENAAGIQQAHRVGIHESGKFYGQFENHQQLRRLVFRDLGLDEKRYIANLPFASLGSLFKGRDEVLEKLKDGLELQDHHHYQGVIAITASTSAAVHGLGGIGKTRAAVEFAIQYREDYCALLFCIADTPSALINNIATFCGPKLLDLPVQHEKETELQYQAALHWLKQHPGWLLIIDNVDNEEAAAAVQKLAGELSGSGQILITSRISDWPGSMLTAALDVLDSDAAIAFLLERTDRAKGRRKADDDEQQAALLAETLGYLPLALEQAGAYICIHEISFAEYLAEWESKREIILNSAHARVMEYPYSVAVTWLTSFDKLTESARHLLYRLAWFSFEPIPESLLGTPIPGVDEDLRDAVTALEAYSLVTKEVWGSFFSIHRLVQEITRNKQLHNSDKAYLLNDLEWLNQHLILNAKESNFPRQDNSASHAKSVAEFADKFGLWQEDLGQFMGMLGRIYGITAQYNTAEKLLLRATEITEHTFGKKHTILADRLGDLASVLYDAGDFTGAESFARHALAIHIKEHDSKPHTVIFDLNTLANTTYKTKGAKEALFYLSHALNRAEALYGTTHPIIATIISNKAAIFLHEKRSKKAEPLFRRALAIYSKTTGLSTPEATTTMNNLASSLSRNTQSSEPEKLLRLALKTDEEIFGLSHPNVARDLTNLAILLKKKGNAKEAIPLAIRSLEIDEDHFGLSHSKVGTDLNNLAWLYWDIGDLHKAEQLLRRCIAIQANIKTPNETTNDKLSFSVVNYYALLKSIGLPKDIITKKFKEINIKPSFSLKLYLNLFYYFGHVKGPIHKYMKNPAKKIQNLFNPG